MSSVDLFSKLNLKTRNNSKYLNLFTFILLFACSSHKNNIEDIKNYQSQPLLKSEIHIQNQDLANKTIKIAVLPFTNKKPKSKYDFNTIYTKELINILKKEKLATDVILVNNKNPKYLKKIQANYLIEPEIIDTEIENRYSLSYQGGIITSSSNYLVTAQIVIYKIPSLEIVNNFEISGLHNQIKSSNSFITKPYYVDFSFFKDSIIDSLEYNKALLRKSFLKTGFILGKIKKGKEILFEINLGSDNGLKHLDKINVIKQKMITNPITNKEEISEEYLASGFVSNIIKKNSAFIILEKNSLDNINDTTSNVISNIIKKDFAIFISEEQKKINNIKKGDLVKIVYDFDYVNSRTRYEKIIEKNNEQEQSEILLNTIFQVALFMLESDR